MPEDPQVVSISSTSPVSPDEIARKSFPAVRKGVDGEAVRAYLAKVAAELRAVLEREAVLRERLGEAERRAAEPVLDEATLTKAIGMETARILSTAHEAARKVVEKAEADAAETLGHAKGVLAEQLALAESQTSAIRVAAEQEAYEYAGRVQAEADAMTEEAHADAVELLDATKEECRRMVAEARDLRNRTLADLVSRRRALRVQLEELRGGKDSLLQVVDSVGAAVEQLRERLIAAEHEARVAAEQAGERAEEQAAGAELGELEAELAAAARSEGDLAPAAAEGAPGVAAPSDEGGDEGTAAEGATTEAAPSSSRRSVDELFARIRASRAAEEAAAAAAQAVVAAAVDAIADGEPSPAGEPPVAVPETVVAPAAAEATPMPPGAGQTPTPGGGHESAEGPEGEEHESAEEPGSAEAVEGPADGAAAGSTAMGEGDDAGSLSAAGATPRTRPSTSPSWSRLGSPGLPIPPFPPRRSWRPRLRRGEGLCSTSRRSSPSPPTPASCWQVSPSSRAPPPSSPRRSCRPGASTPMPSPSPTSSPWRGATTSSARSPPSWAGR